MLRKISYTAIVSIYQNVIGFIVFLITAKIYGSEGRGIVAASNQILTLISTILCFSLGRVLPYLLIGFEQGVPAFFKQNFYSFFYACMGLTIPAGVCVLFLGWFYPAFLGQLEFRYLLISMVSLPYFLWSATSVIVFSTANLIVKQSRIILINRTIYLLIVLTLIYLIKPPIFVYLTIISIINLLQFFSEIKVFFNDFKPFRKIDPVFMKKLFSNAIKIHPDTVANLAYLSFITVIINKLMSLKDVGNFSFALQIIAIINIIPSIINQYIISTITEKGVEESWKIQRRYIYITLGFMLFVTFAAIICYSFLISFLNLESFAESIPVFKILSLSIIPCAFTTMMNSRWITEGRFKQLSIISITNGLLSFGLSYYLIGRYSLLGGAYSYLAAYLLSAGLNFIFFLHINNKYKLRLSRSI